MTNSAQNLNELAEGAGRMTFVETDTNKAPEGGKIVWVEGKGGARIRTAVWPGVGGGRGTVFLMPGKSEYIEKYFEVIAELLERGFAVVSIDWRGQGLSTREIDHPIKAFIGNFEDFLDDFEAVFDVHSRDLEGPWICMAHSMGGNIALRLAGETRTPFDAMILTAPMTSLNMPAIWEKSAGAVALAAVSSGAGGYFIPGAGSYDPLAESFDSNTVTSDPQRHARTVAIVKALPQIAQGGATYAWIHEAIKSIRKIAKPEFGRGIRMPMLIVAASKDKLIDPLTNRYLGVNIPGAEFHMIEGSMHEILMEKDEYRAQFWKYFDDFVVRVLT
jgi:lysophospholipase